MRMTTGFLEDLEDAPKRNEIAQVLGNVRRSSRTNPRELLPLDESVDISFLEELDYFYSQTSRGSF